MKNIRLRYKLMAKTVSQCSTLHYRKMWVWSHNNWGDKGWLSVDRSARLLSFIQDHVSVISRLQRIYASYQSIMNSKWYDPTIQQNLVHISFQRSYILFFQQGFRLRGVQPLSLTWQHLSTDRSINWIHHSCHPTVPLVLSWITGQTTTYQ